MVAAAVMPTKKATEEAQRAVQELRQVHDVVSSALTLKSLPGKAQSVEVALPAEALNLLLQILGHMANGDAITLLPVHKRLTTQQAADIMGVSRPYLIRLLDEGEIPFERTGTHRRIKAQDILEYKKADEARRGAAVDELAAEAEVLGLEY